LVQLYQTSAFVDKAKSSTCHEAESSMLAHHIKAHAVHLCLVHPEAGVAHDQHLGLAAMAEGAELLQPNTGRN
jgi:hypothetical protein